MIEPAALRTVSVFGLDVSTLCFQFVCDSIELLLLYQTSSRAVFPFSIFGNLPRVFLALTSGGRRRPSITVLVLASSKPLLIGWLACASWLILLLLKIVCMCVCVCVCVFLCCFVLFVCCFVHTDTHTHTHTHTHTDKTWLRY